MRAIVCAFERTQVRSNALGRNQLLFKSFLALVSHDLMQCPAQHKTLKLYKTLVINTAKSLTNISKGGSNKQYLTPINDILDQFVMKR
jgi:hypothetical protein